MRPAMSGNQEVDIAIFNQMGVQLASLWPKVEEPLEICNVFPLNILTALTEA